MDWTPDTGRNWYRQNEMKVVERRASMCLDWTVYLCCSLKTRGIDTRFQWTVGRNLVCAVTCETTLFYMYYLFIIRLNGVFIYTHKLLAIQPLPLVTEKCRGIGKTALWLYHLNGNRWEMAISPVTRPLVSIQKETSVFSWCPRQCRRRCRRNG